LHALAYNLGNFMRTLAMPKAVEPWSLTSLREKLIKIGAKVVSHGRSVTFKMAEVAVPGICSGKSCRSSPGCGRRRHQHEGLRDRKAQTTMGEVRLDEGE
jgi:Transposase DDE domain group 1